MLWIRTFGRITVPGCRAFLRSGRWAAGQVILHVRSDWLRGLCTICVDSFALLSRAQFFSYVRRALGPAWHFGEPTTRPKLVRNYCGCKLAHVKAAHGFPSQLGTNIASNRAAHPTSAASRGAGPAQKLQRLRMWKSPGLFPCQRKHAVSKHQCWH